jgi:hypothetical protein
MKFSSFVFALTLSVLSVPGFACLRPTMDERAVQWSTAIVKAKLLSISPKTTLGQITERQGPRGTLGQVKTVFTFRTYEFAVTESLDGPFKKGQKVPVVRIFAVTDAPLICSQNLHQGSVGSEYLLLLRPVEAFELMMHPNIKRPEKGSMIIVHLEPVEGLAKKAMADLGDKIVQARSGEADATPANVQRRIQTILKATDDAKAQPAMRALIQMGPKVVPAVEAAEKNANPQATQRFSDILQELIPPDPIQRVQLTNDPTGAKQDEGDQ